MTPRAAATTPSKPPFATRALAAPEGDAGALLAPAGALLVAEAELDDDEPWSPEAEAEGEVPLEQVSLEGTVKSDSSVKSVHWYRLPSS